MAGSVLKSEGLYDKEYVAKRTVGFDKWKDYILGQEDGIQKDPEWQENETGIPAKDIRALAREWGSKKTYLAAGGIIGFGGACRTATGTDWARGMVCLMGMQGLGKPGINMGGMQQGTPVDTRFYFPGYSEGGFSGDFTGTGAGINMYRYTKCFIAGSVAVGNKGVTDCAEGATVKLFRGKDKIAEVVTDNFGDFKFDGLAENSGSYNLEINLVDYNKTTVEIDLKTSINAGTILLTK